MLHVIDWKTGRADDTQPMQVLLQMWWALETYPELARAVADGSLEIRGYLEYVAAGSTQPVEAAPDFRDQAAETVRAGVAQMRALLADPEQNIPLEIGRLRAPRERALPQLQLRACLRVVCDEYGHIGRPQLRPTTLVHSWAGRRERSRRRTG